MHDYTIKRSYRGTYDSRVEFDTNNGVLRKFNLKTGNHREDHKLVFKRGIKAFMSNKKIVSSTN